MSFLANLPTTGNFSNFKPAAHQYIPKYVCDHETAPLNGSVKSDDTNILIRSLNKKKRNIQPPPDAPMKQSDHKRAATDMFGDKPTTTTTTTTTSSSSSSSSSSNTTTTTTTEDSRLKRLRLSNDTNSTTTSNTATLTQESLEAMTKTQLVTLCKQKSISTAGNKEQLIERILKSNK